jgi:hypothetical protein
MPTQILGGAPQGDAAVQGCPTPANSWCHTTPTGCEGWDSSGSSAPVLTCRLDTPGASPTVTCQCSDGSSLPPPGSNCLDACCDLISDCPPA